MKPRELRNLGVDSRRAMIEARKAFAATIARGDSKSNARRAIHAVVSDPTRFLNDQVFAELARSLSRTSSKPGRTSFSERSLPAPSTIFSDDSDPKSLEQLQNACRLPVSVRASLMPDAHLGYGLPIGGVLATNNAVIPYAVGVDIACRMKLSVLDLPVNSFRGAPDRLVNAIETETRFGIGASFRRPRDHEVLDEDWSVSPVTRDALDKARKQLGTSGSGNHFVEFGTLEIQSSELQIPAGTYVALLSHSGSRGTGARVASYYSRLAMDRRPELPKELRHLAWLDLAAAEGIEYWHAMNLMGKYATANHAVIHQSITHRLGAQVLASVENHHNFAWKERHVVDGETQELIVHRKGATPAGTGVLGVIPGSMASPGFVVRGKGQAASLHSAAHGAGRVMSRRAARSSVTWSDTRKLLDAQGVRLLSAGIDESPFVYKDIHAVMAAQRDLVDVVATFHPKIVKMAPEGERAED